MKLKNGCIRNSLMSLTLLGLSALTPALAWDGDVIGTVVRYDITPGTPGNYDFRVYLTGYPAMCTGGSNWAYLNSNEGNYSTFVAAIMSAKALGQSVHIYTSKDAYNYCHIAFSVLDG